MYKANSICIKQVDFNCNSSYKEKSNEISHYIHIIFLKKKFQKYISKRKKLMLYIDLKSNAFK